MRDLVSSDLPAGYTGAITADQMNRLREDLFKNHDHATDRGGAIAHSDLTDGVLTGTILSHLLLSKHAQGTGTGAGCAWPCIRAVCAWRCSLPVRVANRVWHNRPLQQ